MEIGKEHAKKFWSVYDNRWKVVWKDYNGKNKSSFYAKWWWEIYVGDIPKGYTVVHKDGDYSNISDDNFECITFSENQKRTHINYERDEQYKNKQSKIKLGKKMSEEHRNKTSKSVSQRWATGQFDDVHIGENSPRWRGGQSKHYPPEFFEIREFIVERDRSTCQACGWKIEERKRGHVHHRDGCREHNDQDNLLFLCYLCHGKIHSQSNENEVIMSLRSELFWNSE